MIFILGGAYQGKLEFAKGAFGLEDADIFTCTDGQLDFSYKCINELEEFTLACVRENRSAVDWFRANEALWQDKILICQDISGGVVPIEAEMRRWRNETGSLCQYLASQAQQVSRIFCGLEQRLKG